MAIGIQNTRALLFALNILILLAASSVQAKMDFQDCKTALATPTFGALKAYLDQHQQLLDPHIAGSDPIHCLALNESEFVVISFGSLYYCKLADLQSCTLFPTDFTTPNLYPVDSFDDGQNRHFILLKMPWERHGLVAMGYAIISFEPTSVDSTTYPFHLIDLAIGSSGIDENYCKGPRSYAGMEGHYSPYSTYFPKSAYQIKRPHADQIILEFHLIRKNCITTHITPFKKRIILQEGQFSKPI